jgi:hypothetical protein
MSPPRVTEYCLQLHLPCSCSCHIICNKFVFLRNVFLKIDLPLKSTEHCPQPYVRKATDILSGSFPVLFVYSCLIWHHSASGKHILLSIMCHIASVLYVFEHSHDLCRKSVSDVRMEISLFHPLQYIIECRI